MLVGKEMRALMAQRQALAVAISSAQMMRDTISKKCVHRYIRLERQLRELKVAIKDVEFAIMDDLMFNASDEERRMALFYLLDQDQSGWISADELRDCANKLGGVVVDGNDAEELVVNFGDNNGSCVGVERFQDFLRFLEGKLDCNMKDLCALFMKRIAFAEKGCKILERFLMISRQDSDFGTMLKNIRVELIFEQLDWDFQKELSFHHIARLFLRTTSAMEDIDQRPLIWFLGSSKKRLSRHLGEGDFRQLFSNVCDLYEGYADLAEFCNMLTLFAASDYCPGSFSCKNLGHPVCKPSGYSIDDEKFQSIMSSPAESGTDVAVLERGKLDRLFDWLDIDQDGELSFAELVMAIRLFQDPEELEMERSINQATLVMKTVDPSSTIDRFAFCRFVTKFASLIEGMSLTQLLDFVALQITIREYSNAERTYIDTFSNKAVPSTKPRSRFFGNLRRRERCQPWPKDENRRWHRLDHESRIVGRNTSPKRSRSPSRKISHDPSDIAEQLHQPVAREVNGKGLWKKASLLDDETETTENNISWTSEDSQRSIPSVPENGVFKFKKLSFQMYGGDRVRRLDLLDQSIRSIGGRIKNFRRIPAEKMISES